MTLTAQIDTLHRLQSRQVTGTIVAVRGLTVLAEDLPLPVGTLVRIECAAQSQKDIPFCRGEIVGFDGRRAIIMLFDRTHGISPGSRVIGGQSAQTVNVGRSLLGRVINALGQPIDNKGPLKDTLPVPLNPAPVPALNRRRVIEPLPTGVRAIDSMMTLGKGQRVGIFAGPGVGKSTMLASIARHTSADINVLALVGERGREVREFIEQTLGEEGLSRSVVVVATADESPLLRTRAAMTACSVAEHFRDLGADVLFIMDSITRFAQAQRQIGLTIGEQPATKGYTPSVFAMLPMLLERAGSIDGGGSITGIYAVLVEGDDLTEPISDAVRGILDGHASLSRKLASKGHYPAIDVLESISRVADLVTDTNHRKARQHLQRLIAAYREAEELINIGAYVSGSNIDCDTAIALKPAIDNFLKQEPEERAEYPQTCRRLIELSIEADQIVAASANNNNVPKQRQEPNRRGGGNAETQKRRNV